MRNLTMLMDYYELTMSNGYFEKGFKDKMVVFDMFYRKNPDNGGFVVSAGLEQLIEYIENMHFSKEDIEFLRSKGEFSEGFLQYLADFKFTGNIDALPEGTICYPNTPIVTVTAPVIEAQLIETMLLLTMNFQSLIATKASRICRTAAESGAVVMEFGARRAHGGDAAILGARAAYIGGAAATATVMADERFGVPAIGTMAHSWIQFFDNEYEAFKAYAEVYPDNCTLLIDTYDILNSGLVNAIRVAKEVLEPAGKRLKGVRIDSGDLAYFSKKIRKTLDAHDMQDCKIVVSNSVDEFLMQSLKKQNASIDSYGVGERMITSKSDPVFGGVYKLAAVQNDAGEFVPKIKISENVEKITNPGRKKLWRIYSRETGYALADLITMYDEEVNGDEPFAYVDPVKPWKKMKFENVDVKELQVPIFRDGKLVYDKPELDAIKAYVTEQLDRLMQEDSRVIDGKKVPFRLQQEDFAQALGVPASQKYEKIGDSYLKRVFTLLRQYSDNPVEDQLKLWDICIFNYLIGNTDNHIKNIGLLYGKDRRTIRLAPAYDIVSTMIYEESTEQMAMAIDGELDIRKITKESFRAEARHIGLGERIAMRRFEQMQNSFERALAQAKEEIQDAGYPGVEEIYEKILRKNQPNHHLNRQ